MDLHVSYANPFKLRLLSEYLKNIGIPVKSISDERPRMFGDD